MWWSFWHMDRVTIRLDGNPIGWHSDPYAQHLLYSNLHLDGSSDRMAIRSDSVGSCDDLSESIWRALVCFRGGILRNTLQNSLKYTLNLFSIDITMNTIRKITGSTSVSSFTIVTNETVWNLFIVIPGRLKHASNDQPSNGQPSNGCNIQTDRLHFKRTTPFKRPDLTFLDFLTNLICNEPETRHKTKTTDDCTNRLPLRCWRVLNVESSHLQSLSVSFLS